MQGLYFIKEGRHFLSDWFIVKNKLIIYGNPLLFWYTQQALVAILILRRMKGNIAGKDYPHHWEKNNENSTHCVLGPFISGRRLVVRLACSSLGRESSLSLLSLFKKD